jgi:hypothetical protein
LLRDVSDDTSFGFWKRLARHRRCLHRRPA